MQDRIHIESTQLSRWMFKIWKHVNWIKVNLPYKIMFPILQTAASLRRSIPKGFRGYNFIKRNYISNTSNMFCFYIHIYIYIYTGLGNKNRKGPNSKLVVNTKLEVNTFKSSFIGNSILNTTKFDSTDNLRDRNLSEH